MYWNVKNTVSYLQQDDVNSARTALTYGMRHVKNALAFAEGTKKMHEIEIYSDMKSIVESQNLGKALIISKLNQMLSELEDLEIAYS